MTKHTKNTATNALEEVSLQIGEGIAIDFNRQPRSNGKELGVFMVDGKPFVSRFTKFGKQILFLQTGKPIRTMYAEYVEIIGTVIENDKEKAPAITGADSIHAFA